MTPIQLPVLLLTGYLGSGKTTLLNRILSNKKGIKFAVIVNDIGEVNIDADLISKEGIVNTGDDSLVPLQNGCICCTLKADLAKQVADLAESGKFDYLVIEASGICEPEPIAQAICAMPQVRLDCIATVVDALRMRDEFQSGEALTRSNIDEEDIENLVIQQIEFCNAIVLNKISEISAADADKLKAVIRAIQPSARILECDWCDVPPTTSSTPPPSTSKKWPPPPPGCANWKNRIPKTPTAIMIPTAAVMTTAVVIITTITTITIITTITTTKAKPRNMA